MKKNYEPPVFEIVEIQKEDFIVTYSCKHSQEGFDVPTCPSGFDTCTGW